MTPPLGVFICKIKTIMKFINNDFVFMHLRPSSRGLQDTPSPTQNVLGGTKYDH
jgi:hypothetical protein